jgi:predicted transcriptional regulator
MKAKVKTWINNIENGMIKNVRDKILYTIYSLSKENATDLFDFKPGSIDTETLRERLGVSLATLVARLSELQDEGLIKVIGQKEVNDSVYSKWAFVYSEIEREELIEERKAEKFNQWIDRGLNDFWDRLPLEIKIHLKMTKEKK